MPKIISDIRVRLKLIHWNLLNVRTQIWRWSPVFRKQHGMEWEEKEWEKLLIRLNPFVPNTPFLYPLKTENLKVFWCFQGVEKGCIWSQWVKGEASYRFQYNKRKVWSGRVFLHFCLIKWCQLRMWFYWRLIIELITL